MKYLLDTHTLIWALMEKNKLSVKAQNTLENPDNSIFVSAISFWEISLKFSIGKLSLQGVIPNELPAIVEQMKFKTISLHPDEASTYHRLTSLHHRDPFDRMLIWQALTNNLTLISKDDRMLAYHSDGLKLLW
jgi:PIN domain nuclease of toxin-antitoxin system